MNSQGSLLDSMVELVLQVVTWYFRIDREDLCKGRFTRFRLPRQVAAYFLQRELGVRYRDIEHLLLMDLHTISASVKRIGTLQTSNEEVRRAVKTIGDHLRLILQSRTPLPLARSKAG